MENEKQITARQGVYNELPIPFNYEGQEVSNFTARELTLKEIKQLSKLQYRQNNPFKWVAMACCLSIETIGGVNVYDEYIRTKQFPAIITQLPLLNTNNILVAGHIRTLGEHVETVPSRCQSCGEENEAEIDLLTLDVPFIGKSFDDYIFTVELRNGYDIGAKSSDDNGIPRVYNNMSFRLPTLGDVMKLERDLVSNASSLSEFFEKLLQKCITTIDDGNGVELPANILALKRDTILNKLRPFDWKKVKKEYNKNTPELSLKALTPCENCGADIEYEIDQSFLFQ